LTFVDVVVNLLVLVDLLVLVLVTEPRTASCGERASR